jgi:hypothetical protein
MSEQTKTIFEASSSPVQVKNYTGKEPLKGFDRPFPSDPKQACHAEADLVNQREVLVALGVLDLVYTDRVDGTERAMIESQVTTCSTASKTFSQEVRNASAVSFQESLRAQRARKSM